MSWEYDNYIRLHKNAVGEAYQWLCEIIPELTTMDSLFLLQHDASKTSKEEYDAYDAYFYGNASYAVKEEFNKAWLHHIHNNPHHWQHWILFEDDPSSGEPYICLEMPYKFVIEMICDWWSFSLREDNPDEIFKWYDNHKETMKLHPKTRKTVERILGKIKEHLNETDTGAAAT